jgi:hypothetical protein
MPNGMSGDPVAGLHRFPRIELENFEEYDTVGFQIQLPF